MQKVRVPKVAEAVTEGTVSRWHVQAGDHVDIDQPLVEMITEKAEDDVCSPSAGRIARICAPERSTVPVGYILCVLGEPDEDLSDIDAENAGILARHQAVLMGELPQETDTVAADPEPDKQSSQERTAASPAARRLASAENIALAEIADFLKLDGRITEADVRRYIEQRQH
jgi:2-oxoglutarate dehydrogenase E2 component (dihydrolipoamide succinyltransferase)